jgi:uncharacterized membrane protein
MFQHRKILILAFLAFFLLAFVTGRIAESNAIPWYTMDSGGGCSGSSGFALCGTSGQPDAAGSTGGSYKLSGGLWSGPRFYRYPLYLPVVNK